MILRLLQVLGETNKIFKFIKTTLLKKAVIIYSPITQQNLVTQIELKKTPRAISVPKKDNHTFELWAENS